jgi:cellulose biosynthesis protein BcsQ
MSVPVLTFFNNKGGVGKTSLAYHVSWMLATMGKRVVACDLDPQANLTAGFIDEDAIEQLWDEANTDGETIFRCVQPLLEVGDLRSPVLRQMALNLALVPGDLALAGFEDALSEQWPQSMGETNLYRPFRALTAFWQVAQDAAKQFNADLVLMDVGPNLGAINRSALIASDFVVIPLGADLFSLQGLRNLGPTLRQWRTSWDKRLSNWTKPQFGLPQGRMYPIGYVAQQHGVRLSRPVKAYDRWLNRIPYEYRRSVLGETNPKNCTPAEDEYCLATLKHYRSLVPMGQEARKPIFELTAADGAIGAHAVAVQEAYGHFETLARTIWEHMEAPW